VVTQPNFVAERGDQYLAEIHAAKHDQLRLGLTAEDLECRSEPATVR
jgi:hypothetical protein